MKKSIGGFHTPLQQLLLLEERIRLAGATLPEDVGQHKRFHGIKSVICGCDCLIDIRLVSEVIEDKHVTPIPGSIEWIEGVMNYRGTLVAVYNIYRFLQQADESAYQEDVDDANGPLIILRYANELCAIRVDEVMGMQKYLLDDFKKTVHEGAEVEVLEYYIDASFASDDRTWHRFDVIKLLDEMTGRDPRIQQTPVAADAVKQEQV